VEQFSGKMAGIVTTIYPPRCREINNELGTDELIRRLKTLAHTFQSLSQADDDSSYAEYTALAVHMTDDYFLHNPSRDVQLLIACCIADILRIFAPEAPYKEPAQIKVIFLFLIRQLGGLKDPKDPAFKRYFYLLENLAYVKSFNMCFDLEESTEIFVGLFQKDHPNISSADAQSYVMELRKSNHGKLSGMNVQDIMKKVDSFIKRDRGMSPCGSNEDDNCSICFEVMDGTDSRYLNPCGHRFHINCISLWLESPGGAGSTCPMCRNYIVKEDEFPGLGAARRKF